LSASGDTTPVTLTSADPYAARVEQLRKLFPECWADGRIDFDKLRAALGDAVAAGPERFTFSWAGRADAAALLQTPSRATLVPKPEESVNWDATRNLFVEGDNLEVLKLLYKAYAVRPARPQPRRQDRVVRPGPLLHRVGAPPRGRPP
jgi:adenine-specific DNA-methyltransferase